MAFLEKSATLNGIKKKITERNFWQQWQHNTLLNGNPDYDAFFVDGIRAGRIEGNDDRVWLNVAIILNVVLTVNEARDYAESLARDYWILPALTAMLESTPYSLQLEYVEPRNVSPNGPTVTELSVRLSLLNKTRQDTEELHARASERLRRLRAKALGKDLAGMRH
mmetsp:Transcript_50034/g.119040  ORF Transcript_50034/g.119040 Transcript_50034/m.119040 type:complete len:166 (-) Transcript_50034:189-686(-)